MVDIEYLIELDEVYEKRGIGRLKHEEIYIMRVELGKHLHFIVI